LIKTSDEEYDKNMITVEQDLEDLLQQSPDQLLKITEAGRQNETRIRFATIILKLYKILGESMVNVQEWLSTPHPDLANRTAASYLLEGKPGVVETMIHLIETGQPV
jgi:hypothetical protein